MKLTRFLVTLLICTFSLHASAKCVEFLLHNHTQQILHLTKDPKSDAVCSMPHNLLPGKTGVLRIKQTDVLGSSGVKILKEHPAFISIKTFLNNQQYNLFEEFSVDAQGKRILNEELISKKTALSWEHDKHDIHLCTVKQFTKHQSCNI